MPGLYLLAILVSTAGIVVLDLRFRLALRRAPKQTAVAVAVGLAFFLAWDAVGIATGVFVKGDSPLYLGVMIAPELPLEEVFFLAFLSYLAVVAWSASLRISTRRSSRPAAGVNA